MPGKKLSAQRLASVLAVAVALAAALPAIAVTGSSSGTPLAMEGGGAGP